jgi:hypothetical protein
MNKLQEIVINELASLKETNNTMEVAKQLILLSNISKILDSKKKELESQLKADSNFSSVLLEGEIKDTKVSKVESSTTEVSNEIFDYLALDQIKKVAKVSSTSLQKQVFYEGWMKEKYFISKPKSPSIRIQEVKK